MSADPFIVMAVVTSPHGVSGRTKLKSFANPPTAFAETPDLQDEQGNKVKLRITGGEDTVFIVEIDGLRRREHAELWRGKKLGVPRSKLPDIREEGEFYIADLVGIAVTHENGSAFGVVKEVYNFGAGDIIEITKTDGTDEMYSFTTKTFPTMDVANNRIVISPPEVIKGEEHGAKNG